MKSEKTALIIFVRNPELGKVKTRISRTEGNQKAYDIYVELLKHTRTVATQLDVERYLFYTKNINQSDQWSTAEFNKELQIEGGLGSKMKAAFGRCLNIHNRAIIIGSDCASLSPDHINNAIKKLDENDVVIGPTFDGGYYLLGMKKLHETLFEDIDWSTERVYSQTVEKIQDIGLSHVSIEQLSDIDYIEDWEKWGWEF